jgi:hypothetical protein
MCRSKCDYAGILQQLPDLKKTLCNTADEMRSGDLPTYLFNEYQFDNECECHNNSDYDTTDSDIDNDDDYDSESDSDYDIS